MKAPLVYVIILNWNGLADTMECLSSLDRLTYPSMRTVVIDNASDEDQVLTLPETFPSIVLLRQNENLGFCGGCNVGIRYAVENSADYVLLLNNDTIVSADLIERLLEVFEKNKNAGAVSPVVLGYPATDEIAYARPRWNSRIAGFELKDAVETLEDLSKQEPFKVEFALGCCMLVPAEVYRKAGFLDERYFAYYDEIEWCYRIRRFGYESYVAPQALIHHKLARSTPVPVRCYLMSRNRLLWMKENLPIGERLKSIGFLIKEYLWHALNSLGLTEQRVSRNYSRAYMRGTRDYLRGRFYKWGEDTERKIFDM